MMKLLLVTLFITACSSSPIKRHIAHEGDHGRNSHHFIDRVGGTEVTQWYLCLRPVPFSIPLVDLSSIEMDMPCEDERIKFQYNGDDAFNVSEAHQSDYRSRIRQGLAAFDRGDSFPSITADRNEAPLDWRHDLSAPSDSPTDNDHPFVEKFVKSDWLLIDTSKPCFPENKSRKGKGTEGLTNHLAIEMGLLLETGHTTCGGRTVNDDVIDTLLTVFMNGPERLPKGWYGQTKGDGVRRDDRQYETYHPVPNEFPWVNVITVE